MKDLKRMGFLLEREDSLCKNLSGFPGFTGDTLCVLQMAFTLFIEDCRLAMDWKAVKRIMKATEMISTFFMISHFSELGEVGLLAGGGEPMLASDE